MPASKGGHTVDALRRRIPIVIGVVAAAFAGCGGAGMALYGATAATIYAVEGCEHMCEDEHLQCNPETRLCERLPCDGACPLQTTCDVLRDECVPAGL